jgi:hypothetical protein
MNDAIIREVEQHKHLGVIFQDDGFWNSHIDYIIDKATPRLNLMRKLKFKLSRGLLHIIYINFVRPILEYADIVWDNIPIYLRERLETINIEAARIVTGATKLCSKEKLYVETGWETMSCRRIKHTVIKFHELFHGCAPEYLCNLVPPQLHDLHNYNTRRASNTQTVYSRTSFYRNLPIEVGRNSSKYTLKRFLYRNAVKIPSYFNTGSRRGHVLHTRLRLS